MKGKITNTDAGDPSSIKPSPYVGYYRIGNIVGAWYIYLAEKPKWLHRKFCGLLLGWKWIDRDKEIK